MSARSSTITIIFIFAIALILANAPLAFSGISQSCYYLTNIGILPSVPLILYCLIFRTRSRNEIIFVALGVLVMIAYINFLPLLYDLPPGLPYCESFTESFQTDSLQIALIYTPLVMFFFLGTSFAGFNLMRGLQFLRYAGDVTLLCLLLGIGSGISLAMTALLFSTIQIELEETLVVAIIISTVSVTPVVASLILRPNPNLLRNLLHLLARIFSPIIFVMVSIYLLSLVLGESDLRNDRDLLMVFNLLLVGVMIIAIFSIIEPNHLNNKINLLITLGLVAITLIADSFALFAIISRISEWGFTTNRTVILGQNLVFFFHLLLIAYLLLAYLRAKIDFQTVHRQMIMYLPVYIAWSLFVTFVIPPIFGYS
jgi:hypothetical protein